MEDSMEKLANEFKKMRIHLVNGSEEVFCFGDDFVVGQKLIGLKELPQGLHVETKYAVYLYPNTAILRVQYEKREITEQSEPNPVSE